MKSYEISAVLEGLSKNKDRNIVVVDFGNVQKWEEGLGWKIGIKELKNLIKHISCGKKFLRRFYYGSDFGPNEKSVILSKWSDMVLNKAKINDFEIITKRVKYIPDQNYKTGFLKKCNFDIEMAVDLMKEINNYDTVILFSGDGDFGYLLDYLHNKYNKKSIVFGARGHIGKELYDAKSLKMIDEILYTEDFESRLNKDRIIR